MTIVSEFAEVRWNGYTRKYYESKGYEWTKQNNTFICKIEDLMNSSTVLVMVECDYCGAKHKKKYRTIFKSRELINKDCCSNRECMVKKSKEVSLLKYGYESANSLPEKKEKARKLFQTPFEKVADYCTRKGLNLLSTRMDYENNKSKLRFICTYHSNEGVQESNFANIKKNKTCCFHGGVEATANGIRVDGNKVHNDFITHGLIPNFEPEDYLNNSQPLPFKCNKHLEKGVMYRTYGNLNYTEGCIYCANERTASLLRSSQEEVFAYFMQRGLLPLENENYKSKDMKIKYRCEKHLSSTQEISYHGLKSTSIPCAYCREESSITKLNRRLRSCLDEWKKKSELACNYQCVLTGKNDYEIHHLYSYNKIIEDALATLGLPIKSDYNYDEIQSIKFEMLKLHDTHPLGVCLSKDIHTLFHILYGKKNNTVEQFEEFKIRYVFGEFNGILKTSTKQEGVLID